jgi:glucose/arabinose dehydrogenase
MPLRPVFRCVALVLIVAATLPAAQAQVRFVDAFPDLADFDRPVDLQIAPDGERWFVVEQGGVVTSFPDDAAVSTRDTVLDLRERVFSLPGSEGASWEEGLLGLAFHPDYADNGYLYVYYNAEPVPGDDDHRSVIARFTVTSDDPPTADPATELVFLDIEQPREWHNGGQLAFHPLEDGANLYVSFGDGGGGGDPFNYAQDRTTLFGSILRLDVDNPADGLNYGIPADNPFAGNAEGWREEIWAYGLRNPWRFSIDPVTGHLWVGDVGQNAWEEVTRVTAPGANLGWDVKEAIFCFGDDDPDEPPCDSPDLLDPVWWYPRSEGASVTGGHVYRGADIPEIAGRYVYGDFISGRVWALDASGEEPVNTELAHLPTVLDEPTFVSALGVDAGGELLVATFDFSQRYGRLYRIVRDIVATEPGTPAAATALRLAGPNPFRDRTTFTLQTAAPGPARVAVYDVLGREVAVLHDGPVGTDARELTLDAADLPGGVYLVRLVAGDRVATQRVTVVR